MCGATLKPLHLNNPATSVGNMEVADRLEKFKLGSSYLFDPSYHSWSDTGVKYVLGNIL